MQRKIVNVGVAQVPLFLTSINTMKVLYGLPVLLSAIPRLGAVARILGDHTIGLFTDHPSHIEALDQVDADSWPGTIPVWVNIDVGDQCVFQRGGPLSGPRH